MVTLLLQSREQRDALIERRDNINKTLRYLDYKIDHFEDHMLGYENEKLAYEGKLTEEK